MNPACSAHLCVNGADSRFCLLHTQRTYTYYIYIYAFSRRFYPKRLTVHSGYTCFISMCVPWKLNPQPFALLTQCSTTEPQEHIYTHTNHAGGDFTTPRRLNEDINTWTISPKLIWESLPIPFNLSKNSVILYTHRTLKGINGNPSK